MKKTLFAGISVGLIIFLITPPTSPIGTYVAKHHKNRADTIIIFVNGTYQQSIYRKTNGKRLFYNDGRWFYKEGQIRFSNFFQSDDVTRNENYSYDNVLVTFSTQLERNFFGMPVFDYDEETSIYRYTKLLW